MPLDGVNGNRPPGGAQPSGPVDGPPAGSAEGAVPTGTEPTASGSAGPLPDPALAALVAEARAIASELRLGRCEGREEATRRLVREVLARKLKLSGKVLTRRVASALRDDPRLGQALERIWSEEG